MLRAPATAHPKSPWRIAKAIIAVAVACAALLFLARALYASWSELVRSATSPGFLIWAFLLSLVYGASLFILSSSWYLTLQRHAPGRVPAAQAAYIYCVSNIAKYLPGNVFHFAGRQLLGAKAGWAQLAIAQATILEIGATVAGVFLIVLLAVAAGPDGILRGISLPTWPAALATHHRSIAAATILIGFVAFSVLWRKRLFDRILGVPAASVARAVLLCTLFFCICSILAMLFTSQLPLSSASLPVGTIGLAYLIAWLVGFVVPGAPGGLGVRESMLVLLLNGPDGTGSAIALSLGLGMRLISTLGDAIAVAVALTFCRMQKGATH